jgi:hypothetical protein
LNIKVLSVCLALLFVLAAGASSGAESEIARKFKSALYTKDSAAMTDLVRQKGTRSPPRLSSFFDALTPGQRTGVKFELIEYMASSGRVFGDAI